MSNQKSFCAAKKTLSKMKRHPVDWRKYLSTMRSDIGGLVPKELITTQQRKTKQFHFKSGQKDLNRHFLKKICLWPTGAKGCSTSLIIQQVQIKITARSLHTQQNGYYQKLKGNKYYHGCGERKPFSTVGGSVNYFSHYGKQCGGSSKVKIELTHDPVIPLLEIYKHTQIWTCIHKVKRIPSRSYLHSHIHCSMVHGGQDLEPT